MKKATQNDHSNHEGSIPFTRYPAKSSTYAGSVGKSVGNHRSIDSIGRPLDARFSRHAHTVGLSVIRRVKAALQNNFTGASDRQSVGSTPKRAPNLPVPVLAEPHYAKADRSPADKSQLRQAGSIDGEARESNNTVQRVERADSRGGQNLL